MTRPLLFGLLLPLALAFSWPLNASAAAAPPTLRALLIIVDDYADKESNNIADSVRVDHATVNNFLSLLEERQIAKVERTLLKGRQATDKAVQAALKSMKSAPEDILFVYFSGHGYMEENQAFMAMADGSSTHRGQLMKTLDAKQARLRLMLVDACTNVIDSPPVRTRSFRRSSDGGSAGRYDEIYRQLFHTYSGSFYAAASTEGEYAWSDDDTGGFFTTAFLKDSLQKKPQSSWEANFQQARTLTMQGFSRLPRDQRSEVAAEGIKSQTPRLLAAPKPLTAPSAPAKPAPEKPAPPQAPTKPAPEKPAPPPPAPSKPAPPPAPPEASEEESDEDAEEEEDCGEDCEEEAEEDDGDLVLVNRTGSPLELMRDENGPDEDWTPEKLTTFVLEVDEELPLFGPVTIGFMEGRGRHRQEAWYEIESGIYAFSKNKGGVEIAEIVDGEAGSWLELLVPGLWSAESESQRHRIEFDEEGGFELRQRGETLLTGTWKFEALEPDCDSEGEGCDEEDLDTEIHKLTLETKESGKRVVYEYMLAAVDEDTLVLALAERSAGGKKVSAKKSPLPEELVLFRR